MKKWFLFTVFALLLAISTVKAQVSLVQTASNPNGAITNTSSDTMAYVFSAAKLYSVVAIQPVVTKASGTMAGTAYLYGSIDGVNYVLLDSLTLTNVTTNTVVWKQTNSPYKSFRVVVGGATTVTATVSGKIAFLNP